MSMNYSISVFATDNRPVDSMHLCNVTGTLDDAKAVANAAASKSPENAPLSAWTELHGVWYLEGQHWGYAVREADNAFAEDNAFGAALARK